PFSLRGTLSASSINRRTDMQERLKAQRGQGMTEYIIVVALVAISAIAVFQLFGQTLRSQTAAIARELAGEDGSAESQAARYPAEQEAGQTAARSPKSVTVNADAAGGGPTGQ